MASRKSAVVEPQPAPDDWKEATAPIEPDDPAEAPYNLEPLTDQTRRIVLQWGQATQNRVAELKMSGADGWAAFLEDIFNTVGMFVEGE